MTNNLDLLKWVWKQFWPLIVLFMLVGIHVGTIMVMDFDSALINKKISWVAQVMGCFLIFYSINAHSKTYRNKYLWSLFIDSLRQCPDNKVKPVIMNDRPASITLSDVENDFSWNNDAQSCDDKIEDIRKQIDAMRNEITGSHQPINDPLNEEIVKVTNDINVKNSDLSEEESAVIKVLTPGISLQIFGFMLMVYGAVSGHIA